MEPAPTSCRAASTRETLLSQAVGLRSWRWSPWSWVKPWRACRLAPRKCRPLFFLSFFFYHAVTQESPDHPAHGAVTPHLSPAGAAPTAPSKAVAKTLRQLAGQLLQQQAKQAEAARLAAQPTRKMVRKALAGELAAVLQPLLGMETPPKALTANVKQLAGQLLKQRRKQAKQATKMARNVTPEIKPAAIATADGARPAPRRPVVAARPALPKRAAAKATLVPVATTKGTMVVATTE